MINGSYWIGAALGSGATLLLLDPDIFSVDLGWRLGFGIGAVLGLGILLVRRFVPESPRWLVTHGYVARGRGDGRRHRAAGRCRGRMRGCRAVDPADAIVVHPHRTFGFGHIVRTMFGRYWRRALVGFSLMVAQAFLYNAIFFTYALVLTRFYDVPASVTGLYLLPFAVGNVIGVFALGSLFDTIGRRQMIAATYAALRRAAGHHRLAVRRRRADRDHAHRAVDGDLLHRLAGGERGLPDGQRDLPAGDAGSGDRVLLLARHRRRRHRRALAVRHPDRHRLARQPVLRLPRRRRC